MQGTTQARPRASQPPPIRSGNLVPHPPSGPFEVTALGRAEREAQEQPPKKHTHVPKSPYSRKAFLCTKILVEFCGLDTCSYYCGRFPDRGRNIAIPLQWTPAPPVEPSLTAARLRIWARVEARERDVPEMTSSSLIGTFRDFMSRELSGTLVLGTWRCTLSFRSRSCWTFDVVPGCRLAMALNRSLDLF